MPIGMVTLDNYKHNGSTFDIYASGSVMDMFHFFDRPKTNSMFVFGQAPRL